MTRDNSFNLDEEFNSWIETLKSQPSLIASDIQKMKSLFYNSYESILKDGANERKLSL